MTPPPSPMVLQLKAKAVCCRIFTRTCSPASPMLTSSSLSPVRSTSPWRTNCARGFAPLIQRALRRLALRRPAARGRWRTARGEVRLQLQRGLRCAGELPALPDGRRLRRRRREPLLPRDAHQLQLDAVLHQRSARWRDLQHIRRPPAQCAGLELARRALARPGLRRS